jgi:hypothetical protein
MVAFAWGDMVSQVGKRRVRVARAMACKSPVIGCESDCKREQPRPHGSRGVKAGEFTVDEHKQFLSDIRDVAWFYAKATKCTTNISIFGFEQLPKPMLTPYACALVVQFVTRIHVKIL